MQYSGLENSMNCLVHAVANSQTQPSDFYYVVKFINRLFYFHSVCSSIVRLCHHLLIHVMDYFQFLVTTNKAIQTLVYSFLYGRMFSFPWDKHLGVDSWIL